jgi:hypothetical protein
VRQLWQQEVDARSHWYERSPRLELAGAPEIDPDQNLPRQSGSNFH